MSADFDLTATFDGTVWSVHSVDKCAGEFCCVHNASPHHMRTWQLHFRTDKPGCLAERICPHGIGHPDPDSVAFIHRRLLGIGADMEQYTDVLTHGCDGCCHPPALPPLETTT